jgi:hypothetical protein
MKKRITFSANKKSTIDAIDDYSNAKGYSRSEVISFLLNATAPALNKITSQYHIAQTLESTLGCIFEEKAPQSHGGAKINLRRVFSFRLEHSHSTPERGCRSRFLCAQNTS